MPTMANDHERSFPLRLHSQRASPWSVYDDVKPDGKTPANNVLPPKDADEVPSKLSSDNPSTPHDDYPMEDFPKELPGIMKPSPATAKLTIPTSEISSFNLPSPFSTPHPSESEKADNKVDPRKSPPSSVLFVRAEEKLDGEYGRRRNLERDPDK